MNYDTKEKMENAIYNIYDKKTSLMVARKCHKVLHTVTNDTDNSNVQPHPVFVDRDVNGSKNIRRIALRILAGKLRPDYLSRQPEDNELMWGY